MDTVRNYLKSHLILMDGAMGTYIYQKGIFIDKCYDALNLSNPDLIKTIHQEYLEAGANIIETNTFGANLFKLQQHNLHTQIEEINIKGVQIAKSVSNENTYIAGSIGPLGIKIEPWGELSKIEACHTFQQQAQALLGGGVDLFSLDTFIDINELIQAIRSIRQLSDLPIIAHIAFQEDGKTVYGVTIQEAVHKLSEMELDAIGLNCALGPKQMLDILEQLIALTDLPISVMPNAGLPHFVDGRTFYMATPEYFGVYAKRFIETGARIIGGCCGSTPEHIKKMADSLTQKQTKVCVKTIIQAIDANLESLPDPIAKAKKSKLAQKICNGDFVFLVEMVPPRGRDLSKQLTGAEKLKTGGVDAINIPDGPRASARLNGLALAVNIQEKIKIETVLHYTCRDRNLLGMQSELLGASVLGIHNILAITGDPPMMGDYPQSTAVFDIDSIGLTNILTNLNRGVDVGNKRIGDPTSFLIGVGVDPNSINLEREIDRFKWKVDAGAEYAITQPVFDITALEQFLEKVNSFSIPFIAGAWPLVSLRNAEFMKNEVPGVVVPDAIIQRIAKYNQKDDQLKVGIEIARDMVHKLRKLTQGIQVSAPFGRYSVALEVGTS